MKSKRKSSEKKLIELLPKGKAVFVGDTHGDLEASQHVISRYLDNDTKIIFLGDYVDRGTKSKENIDYLLNEREINPNVILLQGNHEGYKHIDFTPANFWYSLDPKSIQKYAALFDQLPLTVYCNNGLIALHGALPDVSALDDINKISFDKNPKKWFAIVWGDFVKYATRPFVNLSGRPQFDENYFNEIMDRFGCNVLIRSHDPRCDERIYQSRCLTIFTSEAYSRKRTIAVAELSRSVKSIDDLKIINIDE